MRWSPGGWNGWRAQVNKLDGRQRAARHRAGRPALAGCARRRPCAPAGGGQLPASSTLLLAAGLDVEEGRAQLVAARVGVVAARRAARCSTCWQRLGGCCECARGFFSRSMRSASSSRSSSAIELWANAVGLRRALQRHPVAAVLGEQRQPFVVAAGVEQAASWATKSASRVRSRRRHAAASRMSSSCTAPRRGTGCASAARWCR